MTAQEIFELSMALMDEISEVTLSGEHGDTREYKNRALQILNILRCELYPYSEGYKSEAGRRALPRAIKSFDEPIELDGHICAGLLPYALAAHLILDENPTAAAFFLSRYEEQRAMLARGLPADSESIRDVYADEENNNFGEW